MGSLKIKAMRRLGDTEPLVVGDLSLIIIEKDGVPVAVSMDLGDDMGGATYVGHVRDDDFVAMLQQLGLDKTTIIEDGRKLLLPYESLPRVETQRLSP